MIYILMGMLSVIFLIVAYFIGIKHKVSLLHDYHYANVASEDILAYTRWMGFALFLLAMTFIKFCIFEYWFPTYSIWILIIGMVVSFVVLVYTQYRYNKGIFS